MRARIVVTCFVCFLLLCQPARAATLEASYYFNDSLAAAEGGGVPSLVQIGTGGFETDTVFGESRRVYSWSGTRVPNSAHSGLQLNASTLIPGNSYSVELVFKMTEHSGLYRRILDVQNRTSDNGLYVSNTNKLEAYPFAASGLGTFSTNTYHHVVLTNRFTPGNSVQLFLDGQLQQTIASNIMHVNLAVNPNSLLHFFVDNSSGSFNNDFSSGSIALLRIWEDPLTALEVSELAESPFPANSAVPEPSSFAYGTLGLACLALKLYRRRRNTFKS